MKKQTPWPVFIAILLAALVGTWTGADRGLFGITFFSLYDLIGTLFIKALTLIMIPLVSSSIITGIAKIGGESDFGRLGLKTFGFYLSTTFLGVLTGLVFVNLFEPGYGYVLPEQTAQAVSQFQEKITHSESLSLVSILLDIIPSNIIAAFYHSNMLGIIFFSLLFGYAVSKIDSVPGTVLMQFWQGVFQAMLKMTHLIMKCLPLGVFCLVAKVFATTGLSSLKPLALFFITVIIALSVFMFLILPLLLRLLGKINPLRHFQAMGPALITAFSTSSSSAALPVTLECAEKRAGISNKICSLVIPLGTSINLSGSALYECVAAIFVAQAYGIEISFMTQFIVVLLALLTSLGVAGIPSASLVAIVVILKAIGLPIEGIGLFLAVDRLLDMCRTTVNVFSDSCCAVLVARSEGEKTSLS